MKKRLPPLNWLRSFEASARHLNFTLAASELHMTQAAVSQQIKGLETKLGCALFKRLPRGLELTDAGRAYIPGVRESIEKLALVTDEVFGKERSHTLTVRVLDIVLAMFFLITNSYFTKHCSFKKLINYEIFKNPSLSYLYKKLENFLSNYYMFSKKSIFQYLDKNSWKIPRLSIKKIFLSLKAAVILKKLNFFFKRSTCISYHHASKIFELDYRDLENWINELNRTNVMKIKIDKINSFIFKF